MKLYNQDGIVRDVNKLLTLNLRIERDLKAQLLIYREIKCHSLITRVVFSLSFDLLKLTSELSSN